MFGRKEFDDSSDDCRSKKYTYDTESGYNYKNKLAYETQPTTLKTVSVEDSTPRIRGLNSSNLFSEFFALARQILTSYQFRLMTTNPINRKFSVSSRRITSQCRIISRKTKDFCRVLRARKESKAASSTKMKLFNQLQKK